MPNNKTITFNRNQTRMVMQDIRYANDQIVHGANSRTGIQLVVQSSQKFRYSFFTYHQLPI